MALEEVRDHVDVPDPAGGPSRVRLLITAPEDATGAGCFVPVAQDPVSGKWAEARTEAVFDALMLRHVAAGSILLTARGNEIRFHAGSAASPTAAVRGLPFEQGWSTNALSLLDVDGTPYVHKTYRRLDPENHEAELLRRLGAEDSRYTCPYLGGYTYCDTAARTRYPLGLVYGFFPGHGLDAPLRDSLRGLWDAVAGCPEPEAAVLAHVRPLEELLPAGGAFLRGFHTRLDTLLHGAPPRAPGPGFRVAALLDQADLRLRELAAVVREDAELSVPVREAALGSLARQLRALRARAGELDRPPFGAGACHGDLHLSHFLLGPRPAAPAAPAGSSPRMRIIDLSTPCTDPRAPGFRVQSPWQDLVSLRRALEYFSADEAADHTATLLGLPSPEVVRAAAESAAGLRPDAALWTPPALRTLRTVQRAAAAWRARVHQLLLDGYFGGRPAPSAHGAWQLLRLDRLLRETAYNCAHRRTYYQYIDLAFAIGAPHE
ncbi:hypothetical protein ACFO3J_04730 [Streptomyces polygonati]|uniref:Aminoglycoside phosphotransferase domain-containing protein n=1 Tax=Streptomyces polygonati TaxID=1617087 RepID=A0ABV8HGV5_9ACTN